MSESRQPPALLLKTLTVTFGLVTLLLLIVFAVVFYTVRIQVRQSVISSLESMQGLFAALELRRQRDLPGQAATLAENSTLKAALDTYIAEAADERFRWTPATAHHHYTRARKGGGPGPIRRHRCRRHAANDACGRRAVRGFVAARRRRCPRPRNGRVGRRRHARGRRHVPHPDRPAAGRRPANRFALSGDEAGCPSGAGARQPVARADRHRQRRTPARDDAVAGSVQQLSGVAGDDHGERRRHAERRIVRLPARRPADGRELLRAQLDRRASVSGDEPDSHDVHPDGHRRGRCWPSW